MSTNGTTSEKERYQAYLAGREWGLLKQQVKARSGGICERCKINSSDAVHHLTYERKYHEQLEDLQDTCEACHRYTHGLSDEDPLQVRPKQTEIAATLIGIFRTAELLFVFFTDNEPDLDVWNPSSFHVVPKADEHKTASMICGREISPEVMQECFPQSYRGHLGRHFMVTIKEGSPMAPRIVESFRPTNTSIFDPTTLRTDLIYPAQEFFSINAG